MSDTKILQAILDNQISMKEDINGLEKKMDAGFEKVNNRLDSIGESVSYLEDDAPTRENILIWKKRVKIIEKKLAAV